MTFENHTEDECDKCLKSVGKHNLKRLPFLFKDMNDKSHPDLGDGYRQYFVCDDCYKKELRILKCIWNA